MPVEKIMEEKNKQFLQRYFPGLLDSLQLDESPALFDEILVQEGKRKLPTLAITHEGESHFLHSQYNPQQEAERWAASEQVLNRGIVCIIGWGLGYHAIEWIKQHGKSAEAVIIIEPEPQFFRASLHTSDLTSLMNAARVEIVCGYQPEIIQASLMKVVDIFLASELHILLPPFAEYYPSDVLQTIKTELQRLIETKQRMLNHMGEMGVLCQTHIVQNIPTVSQSVFPHQLKSQLKGEPAIIVAAGPSLDRNIHQLKEIHNQSWIFAVDTSAKVLLQQGIKSHFIVTKDPTDLNANHLLTLSIPQDIVIAFDPQISPQVLSNRENTLMCMPNRNHAIHEYLTGVEINKDDELPLSNNVALAAFNLAVHAGCSPIIFVGLDLCFTPGSSHASGTSLQSNVEIMNDGNAIRYSRGEATDSVSTILVEGVDGKMYPTTSNFLDAIRLLERLIQQSGVPCIDASEGGAKITGTTMMSLKDGITTYCTSPLAISKLQSLNPKIPKQDQLQQCIEKIVNHLEHCALTASQTLETISELTIEDLNSAKMKIEEGNKIYHLLQSALERLIVEIHQADYWNPAINNQETLLNRYQHYFNIIHSTCKRFAPLYQQIGQEIH